MLFEDITLLCPDFQVKEHQWVGVQHNAVTYVGGKRPHGDYGEAYPGAGRLLMPGFYNCHAHTPMTLMRGYGENLSLHSWLNQRIFPFEAKLTGEDVYWGTLLGIAEGLRYGIVSSSDMYNFCNDMARAVIESGVKANIGRHVVAFDDKGLAEQPSFQEGRAFFELFNGAADGRLIATMSLHAEYTSTPRVVQELAAYAKDTGAQVQVHLSETKSEKEDCQRRHGKTPPAYFASLGLFDTPVTAAHCVWLEEDDYNILAEKGVTAVTCPASNLKLASGLFQTGRFMDKSIPVCLGTDSVASNNSLQFLADLKLFALLAKGAAQDPTLVTPQQALHTATAAGAACQGREGCGAIRPGFHADLLVLDIDGPSMHPVHNLASNLVYSAAASDVVLTMVDGQVLYRDGHYTTIDIELVKARVDEAVQGILRR